MAADHRCDTEQELTPEAHRLDRRVLVVDADPIFSACLSLALRMLGHETIAPETGFEPAGLDGELQRVDPDVALIATGIGPDSLSHALARTSRISVFALSDYDDPEALVTWIARGASGVFAKSRPFADLVELIDDALRQRTRLGVESRLLLASDAPEDDVVGLTRLTPAEEIVLAHLVSGVSAGEIAHRRGVSLHTVRSQIRSVLRKLDVNSQLAAVAIARQAGWSHGSRPG